MTRDLRLSIFSVFLAVVALPVLVTAVEAEPAPTTAEDAAVEIDPELQKLAAMQSRIDALRGLQNSASAQDRIALESRIEATQVARVALLHDVARRALDESATDEARQRAREAVTAAISRIGPGLVSYIASLEKRITALGEQVAEASGSGALALAQRATALVERIDTAYTLWADHVELIAALGLDDAPLRNDLEIALETRAALAASRVTFRQQLRAAAAARQNKAPDDGDVAMEIALNDELIGADVLALKNTTEIMQRIDLDAAEYQQVLIESTGKLDASTLDGDVAWSMVRKWTAQVKTLVAENGLDALLKLVIVVALIAGFRVLAAAVRRLVTRALDSSRLNVSALLRQMIIRWIGSAVMLIGVLVALSQLGISVGPLLAGLGIAGFIIGFALQETLSNFAAGMMILLYRPFDVGDVIEAAGVLGTVSQMSLVSTTILTADHQTLVVPNSKIWGDVIRNITAQATRRVDLTFGIGYGDDIGHAESVLKNILAAHDKILDEPAPVVEVHTLGESSVDFVVRPWVKTADYWRVYWDITRTVKQRFDEEGISIPFPQRDLHVVVDALKTSIGNPSSTDERSAIA